MNLAERSLVHFALGDESRLRVVDLLASSDLTVRELGADLEMPGNLLAHHLNVLERAGVVERRESEGDRRRRYVSLNRETLQGLMSSAAELTGSVVFICSHNSARSQYAAAYWRARTGETAMSAGSDPVSRVNPIAIRVAGERGLDLGRAVPHGYDAIPATADVLISVCDRAKEGSLPEAGRRLHWSIPDPVPIGKISAFRSAFSEIDRRIDGLTGGTGCP